MAASNLVGLGMKLMRTSFRHYTSLLRNLDPLLIRLPLERDSDESDPEGTRY